MNKHKKNGETLTAYLFLAPQMLLLAALVVLPVVFSLALSFTQWDVVSGISGIRFKGLENFIDMWKDPVFVVSFRNTLLYAVVTVPVSLFLSLIFAVLLNKYVFAKGFLRMIFFLPYISSIVAISIVWKFIFNPKLGPLTLLLHTLGIHNTPEWLASTFWALPSLMVISIWQALGYCIVIYMGGLQNIPADLYEAASIDGAGTIRQLFSITLPMLSPTTFFLLVTRVIQSFQIFTPIMVITQGGPGYSTNVLVYYMYVQGFSYYKMGYASAVAWVMFILVFIVTLIQWQGQKKWVNY